jgi:signal transduction histidine kinase
MNAMAARRQWRIHLADAAVVVLLLLFACYGIGSTGRAEPGLPVPDVAEYVLGVVATVPLLLWRRFPVVAFGLVTGAVAVSLALGYGFGPVMFQLMLATTMLTWKVQGWPLYRVGIGYGVVLIGAFALRYALLANDPAAFLLRWVTSAVLWLVLPAVVGVGLRLQQETKARVRAERARRAAAEEQLRIAQELHDIVGHGLAVIAMQASAGQHVLERDPQRAGQALTAIQETARAALDGLRAEVANLHADDPMTADGARLDGVVGSANSDGVARLNPSDGISDLPRLVDRIRRGGIPVVLDMDPRLDFRSVPVSTGHAAYRIVQEALTNVLRHGGPRATACVEVRSTGTDLVVEVTNTDPRQPGTTPGEPEVVAGMGIRGMHRRARRLGGQIDTGRRPDGGFRVSATLPLPAPVPADLS